MTIVFDFSLDDCNTLEKLGTVIMQNSAVWTMWKLWIAITRRKAREYSIRVRAMWVCYERPVSLPDSVFNHFGVSSYTSLRASGSRLLCCPFLSWIKGSSVVPQMRNIYTMLKLPTLVYVLQVGRPLACSVKLLSMLIGFCTCKVRNILTLLACFRFVVGL